MPINWNAVANGGQKEEPPEPVVEQGPAVKEVKEPDPVPEMVVTKETGVKIIEKPFFNEAFPQAPAAIIGLDPEAVKPLLEVAKARFQREIAEMETAVEVAENFLVVDDRTHKEAIKNAGAIKKMLKALDVERKDVIGGADAFVRGVNAFIKIFKDMSNKAVNQRSISITANVRPIRPRSKRSAGKGKPKPRSKRKRCKQRSTPMPRRAGMKPRKSSLYLKPAKVPSFGRNPVRRRIPVRSGRLKSKTSKRCRASIKSLMTRSSTPISAPVCGISPA